MAVRAERPARGGPVKHPPYWTFAEWARIEDRAREERLERRFSRAPATSTLRLKVARAVADGAALELRQWAELAGDPGKPRKRDRETAPG